MQTLVKWAQVRHAARVLSKPSWTKNLPSRFYNVLTCSCNTHATSFYFLMVENWESTGKQCLLSTDIFWASHLCHPGLLLVQSLRVVLFTHMLNEYITFPYVCMFVYRYYMCTCAHTHIPVQKNIEILWTFFRSCCSYSSVSEFVTEHIIVVCTRLLELIKTFKIR
jgi:hypothetical protein